MRSVHGRHFRLQYQKLEEHIQNLLKIFNALKKHNLKIQFDKCNF